MCCRLWHNKSHRGSNLNHRQRYAFYHIYIDKMKNNKCCGGYSVRSAYHLLTSHDLPWLHTSENLIWHSKVPVNVSILAWRLLHDRLPTKDNLLGRGIITGASSFCLAGCGHVETAQHLFLQCDIASSLWQQVRFWIGVFGVDHVTPRFPNIKISQNNNQSFTT